MYTHGEAGQGLDSGTAAWNADSSKTFKMKNADLIIALNIKKWLTEKYNLRCKEKSHGKNSGEGQ